MDDSRKRCFFADKLQETFGELGYNIEYLEVFCFLLVKIVIEVVVTVLHWHELRFLCGPTFGFVKTMLATFDLFLLSLPTPTHDWDKIKNPAIPLLQNVKGNERSSAPMDEENPNFLYP